MLFGSALKLRGVEEFLNSLDTYTAMPNYSNEFGGKVFKITEDSQGNRLTFLKVTGGSLKVRQILESTGNINSEKINQIRIYSGEKFNAVDEVTAGTVCAVTGITFAHTGDGLGKEKILFTVVRACAYLQSRASAEYRCSHSPCKI